MTSTSTLSAPSSTQGKKAPKRFANNKISTEKKDEKQKPFFAKDIRPGTLIVVE
jgi:hypothetical protein